MSDDVIDFDGDAVVISFRGKKYDLLAADEIDEIHSEIRRLDSLIKPEERLSGEDGSPAKCPNGEDADGESLPFTHGNGLAFTNLLKAHFNAKHALVAPAATVYAIYRQLLLKKETYESFFVNGPSSPPPLASRPPQASADAALETLRSTMQGVSEQLTALKSSTTESSTPSTESVTS